MPMVYAGSKSIFFAHVPKTGGTSIAVYLERRFGHLALSDRRRYRGKTGTGLIVPPDHLANDDLEEFLPPKIDYAFAVVRHPVARMISEYRYQRGSSRLSWFNFSNWLRVVIECAKREPRMYENHIRPQSDLVPEFAEPFKIEEGCEALVEHIDDVVCGPAPEVAVPHLNRSEKIDVHLTQEDVLTIRDFYAVDYERFGYRHLDLAVLPHDRFAAARASLAKAIAPVVVSRHKHGWTS
jgi:hypothetical protein